MTQEELSKRLAQGEIITLSQKEWEELAEGFKLVEAQDTGFAGQISTLHGSPGAVVMEEPTQEERVLRPMQSEEAAAQFVAERMRTYDRMWDGCGCKVDYYR